MRKCEFVFAQPVTFKGENERRNSFFLSFSYQICYFVYLEDIDHSSVLSMFLLGKQILADHRIHQMRERVKQMSYSSYALISWEIIR